MAEPLLVAGVDSSTQSCKLIVVDASSGEVVRSTAMAHPDGTELDPTHWWDALRAVGATELRGVSALSITAQQHSTLFLNRDGESVRDALLWNDTRATPASLALREEWGTQRWLDEIGLLPAGAHPVSKLRWLRDHEPAAAAELERVVLPHDWLTWQLLGKRDEPTTDRSDASATGYWSNATGQYNEEALVLALGRRVEVSRVLGPSERAGVTRGGLVVAAGCGDNAASSLGLGATQGEAVISVGTSMTASMRWEEPVKDLEGRVDDMADASGAHLPLVATLNGARTVIAAARMLGISLAQLDELATTGDPGAGGLTFLPYLDGERNPTLPHASGALLGLTRRSMMPENVARAAILGVASAIADAIDDLDRVGATADSLVLVGGGARLDSLMQAVADLTGRRVERPAQQEYAALGAARQAVWALTGDLPTWQRGAGQVAFPSGDIRWVADVRARHAGLGAQLFGLSGASQVSRTAPSTDWPS